MTSQKRSIVFRVHTNYNIHMLLCTRMCYQGSWCRCQAKIVSSPCVCMHHVSQFQWSHVVVNGNNLDIIVINSDHTSKLRWSLKRFAEGLYVCMISIQISNPSSRPWCCQCISEDREGPWQHWMSEWVQARQKESSNEQQKHSTCCELTTRHNWTRRNYTQGDSNHKLGPWRMPYRMLNRPR